MTKRAAFFATLTTLSLCGCSLEDTESSNVSNEQLWANISVEDRDGQTARIVAELNEGDAFGANVVLSEGESFEVSSDDVTVVMGFDHDLFDIDYQAYLPVSAEPSEFKVDLYRRDEPDILDSTVVMPESFDVTSPTSGEQLFSSTPVAIDWSPALDGDVIITVTLQCPTETNEQVGENTTVITSDDGSYIIDFRTQLLDKMIGYDETRNCEAKIIVRRTRTGVLSSGFGDGGQIEAARRRDVNDLVLTIDD